MNNNKAGEFIDMYPDRSLYSFVPKYNKHRDRQENNWDYCLTYPYTSVTDHKLVYEANYNYNGIECVLICTSDIVLGDDNTLLLFKTYVKHNLNVGSKLKIAMFFGGTSAETAVSISVVGIGNGGYDAEHYFSVRLSDITSLLELLDVDNNDIVKCEEFKNITFRYAKYVNGCRCKYYFRKFRKIPNFIGTNIDPNDGVSDSEIETIISGKKQVFNTSLNKIGFAENAYSDKIVEIIFNDDVNVTGLKDNLGRALSEIYLTIVKTNYGHNKWYEQKKYTDPDIEFSHCFGKITTGLDMENGKLDYNVHTIHNIPTNNAWKYIPKAGESIEDDVTISNDDFFGDLVELSPYTLEETTLEVIYHRFNTAQREYVKDNDKEFYDIFYDDIAFDDFDIQQTVNGENYNGFRIRKAPYCSVTPNETENQFPGNLMPEGYYYQPHYKIKLKDYSPEVSWGSNQKVMFTIENSDSENNIYEIRTLTNYYFNVKDNFILYDKKTLNKIIGTIVHVSGKYYTEITLAAELDDGKELDDYLMFKINPIRPNSAYDLDDGTGRYVWRNFLPSSALTTENELYNEPFVNGAHYKFKNINFYLRRQDPYGLYGLSVSLTTQIPLPLANLIIGGNEADIDKFDYVESINNIC